ncbi:MAG: tetratricopeptide repeat protein [Casimicrobiaceae bacterium]
MLAAGKDGALLRFSLGTGYLIAGDAQAAVPHLAKALEFDPRYTAAWKFYAKALLAAGRDADARNAYAEGIRVANERGDKQAGKEMTVFLRRLESATQGRAPGETPALPEG